MALWTPALRDTALWIDPRDESSLTLESGAASDTVYIEVGGNQRQSLFTKTAQAITHGPYHVEV